VTVCQARKCSAWIAGQSLSSWEPKVAYASLHIQYLVSDACSGRRRHLLLHGSLLEKKRKSRFRYPFILSQPTHPHQLEPPLRSTLHCIPPAPLRLCSFAASCACVPLHPASGSAECTVSAPSRPERLVWGDQVLEALEGLQPCLQAFNSFAIGHPLTGTIRLRLASSRPGSGWKLQFDLFASFAETIPSVRCTT